MGSGGGPMWVGWLVHGGGPMLVGFVYVCAVWVDGFSGGVGLCGPVVLIVWL